MDPAIQRVLDAIAAAGLRAGTPVVALLSGGRDSVCLLDALATGCGPEAALALHVNYGLRAEAGAEERGCRELCERSGVALEVVRAQRPEGAGNLQAWARDVRYAAAARAAAAWRPAPGSAAALVATGHTATDQVETVLYRLASSPGRRALLGMPGREGILVRPLLSLGRDDTAAYCVARGLRWSEDASNAQTGYARNRVRGAVVPALRTIHPAAEANVLRTAGLLRDEAAVLDEVVATALAGRDRIALSRLAQLPPALARLVVIRLAERAGGRFVPSAGERLAELLALAPAGGSGELDVGGGVRAVVEYGVLRMTTAAARATPACPPASLAVPGSARFGDWQLECALEPVDAAALRGAGADRATLDAAAAGDLLSVRSWRAGDRIRPLGLGGTKTLADLFAARRVPRAQRATIPVVTVGEAIAWVPGVATAERFRVGCQTRHAIVVRARRERGGRHDGEAPA